MLSLISDYCAIRAAMLRLGLGFMLVLGGAEAQAMEAEEDFFAPKLDLLTTQVMNPRADVMLDHRFSASVVLARPADTLPFGSRLGTSSQLPFAAEPKQDSVRPTNASWRQAYDRGRGSLLHLLRLEFGGDPVKVTFRPNSVSIRGERLNIQLKPNLVSMLWSKAF